MKPQQMAGCDVILRLVGMAIDPAVHCDQDGGVNCPVSKVLTRCACCMIAGYEQYVQTRCRLPAGIQSVV
jgi:hypothetical protein